MRHYIKSHLQEAYESKKRILDDEEIVNCIEQICKTIVNSYKNGNKILIAGNGGSAADAQHIAGELVSRFYFDRPALSAIALTTDTSIITAIGNDYGYETIFARQIQANGQAGDVFIGISTSGQSTNVINAIEECKKKNIITIGLTGKTGGKLSKICDHCIEIPSSETPRIQEGHCLIGHIICATVEKELFGSKF